MSPHRQLNGSSTLQPVIAVKLASISDLVRMASSVAAAMQPTYIVRYRSNNGKIILGFLAVFRDYYNYYGIPMFYYVVDENESFREAKYVLIKLDESGERIEPSRTTKPGYIAIPIVNIESAPEFLLPKNIE